ncbi:N-acetyltransferase [Rheinheimera sp. D18]|uniref:GNAT family N-acetyltransferase n=1 Tax=Rheinheimera sp. D18 TaxID=2545632 RepID=UPI0010442801|nr:N-acetyltransferase [Rheinheimera sp. D18]QBL08629.1 N-acetyltransferase [Rheinheimera sp. D18]
MTLLHNINRALQRRRNSTWHAMGYDTSVRLTTAADADAVALLTQTVFHNNTNVNVINSLRQACSNCISLVAEQHGKIVGHILFAPATLEQSGNTQLMALATMAVSNVLQHHGIGSALVRAGLELCRQQSITAVVVLGPASYYSRFGFVPAVNFNIHSPVQALGNTFMLLPLAEAALQGKGGKVLYLDAFTAL